MVDGQRITRTVDGNTFEIVSSANVIYINGFPVTIDQWNQVLNGKEVSKTIFPWKRSDFIFNWVKYNV